MPNGLHNKRQDTLEETESNEYQQSYHLIYDRDHVLDARWHGNLYRHLNHSCNPNCLAVKRHAYGIQIILIVAKRHLAKGEECTLNYGTTKPVPCRCTHCVCTSPPTTMSQLHSSPVPTTRTPNAASNTLDDTANLSDHHIDLNSVNKKRFKYLKSYSTSISKLLPLLLVIATQILRSLPACTRELRSTRTHPAHKYTNPTFRGCITGDGPKPTVSPSKLNPYALAFFPRKISSSLDAHSPTHHIAGRNSAAPTNPRHTKRYQHKKKSSRTPPIAPTQPTIRSPATPHPNTQTLWKHLTPVLNDSTFMQFSDSFDSHTLTHTCSTPESHDLRVGYLNIRTLNVEKHFFIAAFMFHYQIDVLFLIDTRITNEDQSKHTLRACLGHGYTILYTPPIKQSPSGQTIIVAPS